MDVVLLDSTLCSTFLLTFSRNPKFRKTSATDHMSDTYESATVWGRVAPLPVGMIGAIGNRQAVNHSRSLVMHPAALHEFGSRSRAGGARRRSKTDKDGPAALDEKT